MSPRILFLTPQLPYPPEQGTSLRNYNILRGLLQRYQVTLLSYVQSQPSREVLERLSECDAVVTVPDSMRSTATRVRRMFSDRRPDMAHRLQSTEFEGALLELLRKGGERGDGSRDGFDLIQVEGIELAFVFELIRANSPQSKILFDDHNAEFELQRRAYLADRYKPSRLFAAIYSRIQARRLVVYEKQVSNLADHVVAVSEKDASLLRSLGLRTPVSIIPNSIDLEEYVPMFTQPVRFDVVFVGKMDYRPNVDAVLWFAHYIWPQIRKERPETTWAIVGKNPHARLKKLKEQGGVTVTGRVERVQPYLNSSKVCLMPFRVGSGTRLKLIEAMASGRAIVSTTVGAEGFNVRPGEQLMIADEPAAFADATLALLSNDQRRYELGKAARQFAMQYDWRQVAPQFYQIIDGLLEQN